MKEIGGMMLRLVSTIFAVIGVVVVFVAMYFLYDAIMVTEYNVSNKLQMLMWLGVLVEGVIFGWFGFYGAMNALDYDEDANRKCIKYGIITLICSLINGIVIAVKLNIWAVMSLVVVGIPLLLSILYILSTWLKMQGMKKED